MIQHLGCGLILSMSLLSGCTTYSLVNSTSEAGNQVCRLNDVDILSENVLGISERSGHTLGIKKLDSNKMKFWVKFFPHNSLRDPISTPGVILKIYKNSKIVHEYDFNDGAIHHATDLPKSESTFSKLDIWPRSLEFISINDSKRKAVSFTLFKEQFNKVLEADNLILLIQTHFEPVIISIQRDSFSPLIEFNKQCYG